MFQFEVVLTVVVSTAKEDLLHGDSGTSLRHFIKFEFKLLTWIL